MRRNRICGGIVALGLGIAFLGGLPTGDPLGSQAQAAAPVKVFPQITQRHKAHHHHRSVKHEKHRVAREVRHNSAVKRLPQIRPVTPKLFPKKF